MTPYEFSVYVDGVSDKQKDEMRESMFSAWIGEYLARQKHLPSLEEFLALANPKPKEIMTAKDFEQMRKEISGR